LAIFVLVETAQQQLQRELEIQGNEDVNAILDTIILWLGDHYTKAALIDLATSVLAPELVDEDIETRLTVCARYVRYFCLVSATRSKGLILGKRLRGALIDSIMTVLSFESNESNISQIKRGLGKSNDPPV
jgi:urease gamma subunit